MNEEQSSYFNGKHIEGGTVQGLYETSDDFLKEYLRKSCTLSNLLFEKYINNKLFYALKYSDNEYIKLLNYVQNTGYKRNEHISITPVLKGMKNKLILKDYYTWSTDVEGEIAAESLSVNNLVLNFYDPFYQCDKENFCREKMQDVYLSAIALTAEKLEERDDVYTEGTPYEMYLEEFLKENPDKTEADFEPPVIEMRAEHFRMFVYKDTTSIVEIVGLIEDMEYIEVFDKKFAVLKVNLEHREDDEYLYVNVYIGEHLLEKYKPEIGDGLHAIIHMYGYFEQNEDKYLTSTVINKEQDTKKQEKEYTAFGVTGGIGTMIFLAVILLLGKYAFWANLSGFIEFIKSFFGGH